MGDDLRHWIKHRPSHCRYLIRVLYIRCVLSGDFCSEICGILNGERHLSVMLGSSRNTSNRAMDIRHNAGDQQSTLRQGSNC